MPLRVAAISFLNPAPLLYNFEHAPARAELRTRYDVHYTSPARCAAELHAGDADLGLIPIAELTPELSVVPGCTIASLEEVRSILFLVRVRNGESLTDSLGRVCSIAADNASRSSAAYLRVLLGRFYNVHPPLMQHIADPLTMLANHDAALLIGDPALLAREQRAEIDRTIETTSSDTLLWLDIAQLWRQHTGLPWVAAVWAVRAQALAPAGLPASQLIADLARSRDAGLANVEELVAEWTGRLPLPPETIRVYLTRNIYYHLDAPCLEAIRLFRQYAAEGQILPPLPKLQMLVA
ncbi:MAG: menaquinone biosynthetic enzyme MqnA/MqnD family protein [Janthinobacterium lividum]